MEEETGKTESFIEFSLFEGDFYNKFFTYIGLKVSTVPLLIARCFVLIGLTWIPLAILSLLQGVALGGPQGQNFLEDVAAIGQFWIGLPLFIFAEMELSRRTRTAGRGLYYSGVVMDQDRPLLLQLHRWIEKLRRRWLPDLICAAIAYICTFLWIHAELHNGRGTWHALLDGDHETLTWAGWWVCVIAVPLLNYSWLRWAWKIILWCKYLSRVSRLQLHLVATHPDQTGGLGFLSRAQAGFALAIFAFGLGIVGASVGYKLSVEGASLSSFAVWGPLAGFAVGAPVFFVLPLLFFTKSLLRAKRRAVHKYEEQAMEAASVFEQSWLEGKFKGEGGLFSTHISGLNNIYSLGKRLDEMRVVPFDVESFTQLIGSGLSPVLFLIPHIFSLSDPVKDGLEIAKKLFGGG